MSNVWETTTDDVKTVLETHGITVSEDRLNDIHSELDHDAIEGAVLDWNSMDNQTAAMLESIESQLIDCEVILNGERKFLMEDDIDDDDDFGTDDEDYDDDFEDADDEFESLDD